MCSIIDWEMAIPGVGKLSAAEVLEVADGQIVRGELFYDRAPLRRAIRGARELAQLPPPHEAGDRCEGRPVSARSSADISFEELAERYRRELLVQR